MARRRETIYSLPQFEYEPGKQYIDFEDSVTILDRDFASNSAIPDIDFFSEDDPYKDWAFKSIADEAFSNTSLGGHIAIGMPYGFTSFADLPRQGRDINKDIFVTNRFSSNLGMGRYYADTILKYSKPRTLLLEAGIPEHRSVFSFFSEAISYRESVLAREGRIPTFFNLAKAIGTATTIVTGVVYFPRTLALLSIGSIVTVVAGDLDPRFYTFKPAMHNYLQCADTLFKNFILERGLLRVNISQQDIEKNKDSYGEYMTIDLDLLNDLKDAIPDIFTDRGELSIFKIVSRPQLIVSAMVRRERAMLAENRDKKEIPVVDVSNITDNQATEFMAKMFKLNSFKSTFDPDGKIDISGQEVPVNNINIDPKEYTKLDKTTGLTKRLPHDNTTWLEEKAKYYDTVRDMGFETVGFYVDYVGSSTYTFSNETKDIPAKSMINSVGGASRDARFSLANSSMFGEVVKDITNTAKDILFGFGEGLSLGITNIISSLLGGGYISFPKMWNDSSISLPNHTFKMTLGGPYGNDLSRIMDIDAPLSLILAAALPISVGRASYTSPFLTRAFLQGITDIDFGMITNLTITAGTGTLARKEDGSPLQIEVSFTITDFTDIVAPRMPNGILGPFSMQVDEYSSMHRVARTLTGRSFHASRYKFKNFKYRMGALGSIAGNLFDSAYIGSLASDTVVSELFKIGTLDDKATSLFSN